VRPPDGTFNAQARATAEGALLIVNTGLVTVLYSGTSAMTHDARFSTPGAGTPLYSERQIAEAFAMMLAAYVALGEAARGGRLGPHGGVRGEWHDSLSNLSQLFAIAHEFGHVIAGHVSPAANTRELPGAPDARYVAKSFAQEFEADRLAARIIAHHPGIPEDPRNASIAAAGPAIFFALADAIERFRAHFRPRQASPDADHPPPRERADAVRAELGRHFRPDDFELADVAATWIENKTQMAIEHFGEAASGAS
jgi:hypothetical protein